MKVQYFVRTSGSNTLGYILYGDNLYSFHSDSVPVVYLREDDVYVQPNNETGMYTVVDGPFEQEGNFFAVRGSLYTWPTPMARFTWTEGKRYTVTGDVINGNKPFYIADSLMSLLGPFKYTSYLEVKPGLFELEGVVSSGKDFLLSFLGVNTKVKAYPLYTQAA